MRKNELMLINRFGVLANVGIVNFKQLVNESRYPRSDHFENLSKYILSFFPQAWQVVVNEALEVNSEISYENEFPMQNLTLVQHKVLTVKNLRKTFCESIVIEPYPYKNYNKFQLDESSTHNPFIHIRKYCHAPRDRFFKYRILQGDIFCNERLARFRMVDSPLCAFCVDQDTVESIKHCLWDCNRAKSVWTYLGSLLQRAFNVSYINYKTVVLGAENAIPAAETIILVALKAILVKDRSGPLTTTEIKTEIKGRIKAQFIIEKRAMQNKMRKFASKWSSLEPFLFTDI